MIRAEYFSRTLSPLDNATVCQVVSNIVWGDREAISPEFACTMGVFDGDKLIGGTIYHHWEPEAGVIELTSGSVSRRWLTKPVIKAMFALPFDRLGCQMVALRVSDRNTNMIGIARTFGFDEVHIPRLRGRDEGEFIFTLTDDQWRASRYNRHED